MILRDHSKDKIIQAMEDNLDAFTSLLPLNNPNYVIDDFGDMVRVTTGLPHPIVNWITSVRFNDQNAERRIAENMQFYHEKKLPMMWGITPSSTPSNILTLLENAGLQIPKEGSPGMAYDLRDLTDDHWEEALARAKVQVTEVESESSLKLWGEVFQEGYGISETITEKFLILFELLSSVLVNYLATLNEKPVAIASVAYHGGVAGIFNVATKPAFRGKGIGTTVTLAPLMAAKKKGYEIAWLESSEMAEKLYKRIGFGEYCRLFRCFYSPDQEDSLLQGEAESAQ
ncbi:MAG: GNAT family N-acetyltransferase [Candidatus Heimdallarchaeota archaeon]